MERLSTGLKDLDEKISGGYPRNRSILVSGTSGSGKTVLGLHFIHKCCLDGKKCVIIATEETPEDLLSQAESIGRPLSKYFNNSLMIYRVYEERAKYAMDVLTYDIEDIDQIQSNIIGLLEKIPENTDVVLIDNVGVLTLNMSPNEFRAQFDALIHALSKRNVTVMLIMDLSSDERIGNIAAYSVYGLLRTSLKDNPFTGARERLIEILKIRNTKIPPFQ